VTDPTALPGFLSSTDPPAGSSSSDSAEHALRGRVVGALDAEGFRPEIDEDGDVAVRVEGQSLFVRCFDTSPPLIRVFGQWGIGPDVPGDTHTRLRAANAMTGALNLVKVTALDDWLVIAVDLIVNEATELRSLLSASLEAVRGSVQTWHSTVVQLMEEPGD
jgi:hypothetical protein